MHVVVHGIVCITEPAGRSVAQPHSRMVLICCMVAGSLLALTLDTWSLSALITPVRCRSEVSIFFDPNVKFLGGQLTPLTHTSRAPA